MGHCTLSVEEITRLEEKVAALLPPSKQKSYAGLCNQLKGQPNTNRRANFSEAVLAYLTDLNLNRLPKTTETPTSGTPNGVGRTTVSRSPAKTGTSRSPSKVVASARAHLPRGANGVARRQLAHTNDAEQHASDASENVNNSNNTTEQVGPDGVAVGGPVRLHAARTPSDGAFSLDRAELSSSGGVSGASSATTDHTVTASEASSSSRPRSRSRPSSRPSSRTSLSRSRSSSQDPDNASASTSTSTSSSLSASSFPLLCEKDSEPSATNGLAHLPMARTFAVPALPTKTSRPTHVPPATTLAGLADGPADPSQAKPFDTDNTAATPSLTRQRPEPFSTPRTSRAVVMEVQKRSAQRRARVAERVKPPSSSPIATPSFPALASASTAVFSTVAATPAPTPTSHTTSATATTLSSAATTPAHAVLTSAISTAVPASLSAVPTILAKGPSSSPSVQQYGTFTNPRPLSAASSSSSLLRATDAQSVLRQLYSSTTKSGRSSLASSTSDSSRLTFNLLEAQGDSADQEAPCTLESLDTIHLLTFDHITLRTDTGRFVSVASDTAGQWQLRGDGLIPVELHFASVSQSSPGVPIKVQDTVHVVCHVPQQTGYVTGQAQFRTKRYVGVGRDGSVMLCADVKEAERSHVKLAWKILNAAMVRSGSMLLASDSHHDDDREQTQPQQHAGDSKTETATEVVGAGLQAARPVAVHGKIALMSFGNGSYLSLDEKDGRLVSVRTTSIGPLQAFRLNLPAIAREPDMWLGRPGPIQPAAERDWPEQPGGDIALLPLQQQEHLLADDLLWALLGEEGQYILPGQTVDPSGLPEMAISPALRDPSLRALLQNFLPICAHYISLSHFVSTRQGCEWGLVSQALSAALATRLDAYQLLVLQLEQEHRARRLTLLRAKYYLQAWARTLQSLHVVIGQVRTQRVTGGALLNVLDSELNKIRGDRDASVVVLDMLTAAARPYFELLSQWVYQGAVEDPTGEFMVKLKREVSKERLAKELLESWDSRVVVIPENILRALRPYEQKILATGKYLNAIRECGRTIPSPKHSRITYDPDERTYAPILEEAFTFASRELLSLLREHRLEARLLSLKRFLLMDQGDFLIAFMDLARQQLLLKARTEQGNNASKLKHWLTRAVRDSNAQQDPYWSLLGVGITKCSLLQSVALWTKASRQDPLQGLSIPPDLQEDRLSGFAALTFTYEVEWPLSLVLSKSALVKYQFLFRHLFFLKHVERQLGLAWRAQQMSKSLHLSSLLSSASQSANRADDPDFLSDAKLALAQSLLKRAVHLRHRMVHVVNSLEYFFMADILEQEWQAFSARLPAVHTLDQLVEHHTSFLNNCLSGMLVSSYRTLHALVSLFLTCLHFAEAQETTFQQAELSGRVARFGAPTWDNNPGGRKEDWEGDRCMKEVNARKLGNAERSKQLALALLTEEYSKNLQTHETRFDQQFSELLERLAENSNSKTSNQLTENLKRRIAQLLIRLDPRGAYSPHL
eukprot:g20076.t1